MLDYFSGLALGLSLIVAIGSQNAYVIRQGLRGEHVAPVALTCALSDGILIALGVGGVGFIVSLNKYLSSALVVTGCIFLFVLGARHLVSALRAKAGLDVEKQGSRSVIEVVGVCLALTWLNPHVYIETVFLIGAVASAQSEPWAFGAGAITASFLFFFSLAYASQFFANVIKLERVWRLIEVCIALILWFVGYRLLHDWLNGQII